jgi:hypothetical protein
MSKIEMREAEAGDSTDWNHAWQLVAQLAEARATALREIGAPDTAPPAAADQNALAATLPSNQLARDMIEIERAARALRRAEPLLEPSQPASESAVEMRGARSIWLLVSLIWLTALLVVSCGVAAVALLLG